MMSKGTILIVDDDKDITTSLKVILETRGFKICSAVTGHEALEKLKGVAKPFGAEADLVQVMVARIR